MPPPVSHESLDRSEPAAVLRPRSTALALALLLALLTYWFEVLPGALRGAIVVLALALVVGAALRARWLEPLARGWMRVTRAIGRVLDPLLLGAMFTLLFVPVGLAMRWSGRDALRLRRVSGEASYWRPREDPSAPGLGMDNQF